jgi:MurNAc alpha-1-phosphate uridylyltransferase
MKAMIFAAGVGSRLKEHTRDTPKCLMDVGGKTMLEHVVDRLKGVGVSALAINTHHHAEKVADFVKSKSYFGLEVLVSYEPTLLDTGGGLRKVAPFFAQEEAFLIHNADIFSTIDLSALVEHHRSRRAIGTLAVMERPSKRGLYLDSHDHLVGWTQDGHAPPKEASLYSFSGVSVASHELFSHMEGDGAFSIIASYLSAARATHRVYGMNITGAEWTDIGTPEQLETLRKNLSM